MRGKSYNERLQAMNIFPLSYRRERGDLITLFNIMNGKMGETLKDLFTSNTRSGQRGHTRTRSQLRRDGIPKDVMYSHRVIPQWNNLPKDVVEASTLTSFKLRLDNSMGYT